MNLVGNHELRARLAQSVNNNSPAPSYLFTGPQGVGKGLTALWFASSLLCTEANKPCGQCRNCIRVANGNHPDVMQLDSVEGKASLGIEEIRSGIAAVQTCPCESDYRFWILGQAHRLTEEAQSALLKTLEEPPPYLVVILVSSMQKALLSTVVSRCRLYRFDSVPPDELGAFLLAQGYSESQARVAARVCQGSPGQALAWLDDAAASQLRQQTLDIAQSLVQANLWECLEAAAELESLNTHKSDPKRDYRAILDTLQSYFRDALCWAVGTDQSLLVNVDYLDSLVTLSQQLGVEQLAKILEAVDEASYHLERNVQSKLLWQNLCLAINQHE